MKLSDHKVIGTLLVRDEADIVEQCLKHHLSNGVDGFIVTDNGSKDNTRKLLSSHSGVLKIIDESSYTYNQDMWVTKMARMAYLCGATWVLNIDADEFWYGMEYLKDIPPLYGQVLIKEIYDHIALTPGDTSFDRASQPYYYKRQTTHGKVIHRANEHVRVVFGNHRVKGIPGKYLRHSPYFYIHHYPNRTLHHFRKKCEYAGSYVTRVTPNVKTHWRQLFELFETGKMDEYYLNNVMWSQEQLSEGLATGVVQHDDKASCPQTRGILTGASEARTE